MLALWIIFQAISGQKEKKKRQAQQPPEDADIAQLPFRIRIPSLEIEMQEAAGEPEHIEALPEPPVPARPPRKAPASPVATRQGDQILEQLARGLTSPQGAFSAVAYAEILGKPKALRKRRRI